MSTLYHSLIYTPLYNLLVFLFKISPGADAGTTVILLTLAVRFILFPLSKKAITTQVLMQKIQPELQEIKEEHKDNQEAQAKATLALYKSKGINPFSGIFMLIIQLPIIWALYRIFLYGGLPIVDASLLYSFVHAPAHVSTHFLGLINITGKSVVLAALAAISSFFQINLATGRQQVPKGKGLGDNLARNMHTQMKYFYPLIVFFISYKISGVVALYWLTTNLFTIGQELVVRKKLLNTNQA
jgi:YidC/Oxa1 family membrane protein insertase